MNDTILSQSVELPAQAANTVYAVNNSQDKSMFLAIGVTRRGDQTISWFDGGHNRVMGGQITNIQPDGSFELLAPNNHRIEFKLLTLDGYRSSIMPRLHPKTDFPSEEQMRNALFAIAQSRID
jgi:hypothetical protein